MHRVLFLGRKAALCASADLLLRYSTTVDASVSCCLPFFPFLSPPFCCHSLHFLHFCCASHLVMLYCRRFCHTLSVCLCVCVSLCVAVGVYGLHLLLCSNSGFVWMTVWMFVCCCEVGDLSTNTATDIHMFLLVGTPLDINDIDIVTLTVCNTNFKVILCNFSTIKTDLKLF